jgi:hypothetical protein
MNIYDIQDDGSCIRIYLKGKVVAIVEDYYFGGHVHAAIRQLLEDVEEKRQTIMSLQPKDHE